MNIPDGDDAHLLFIPLNEDIDEQSEDWFISSLADIARHDSQRFLKDLPTPHQHPTYVKDNSKRLTARNAKVSVSVELVDSHPPSSRTLQLEPFRLTKLQNIAETLTKTKGWDESRGQFELCFYARGHQNVRILFDVVKLSEYMEKYHKKHTIRKEHLTPLEESFEESIGMAHSIIDEMHYMEKREARMKQTTDSTNSRIRYFSYLSVIILISVTYVQIGYLKNYFKKKKIL